MKRHIWALLGIAIAAVLYFTGCLEAQASEALLSSRLRVTATTTMLADLAREVGGGRVVVTGLMPAGANPHSYAPSSQDLKALRQADVVVYNGLNLERAMAEDLEALSKEGSPLICVGEELPWEQILILQGDTPTPDPHFWLDVTLWMEAAKAVAKGFSQVDPEHESVYHLNLNRYLKKLEKLDTYIRKQTTRIPQEQRTLISVHNAFGYFGRAYGFEVGSLSHFADQSKGAGTNAAALEQFSGCGMTVFAQSTVPAETVKALQRSIEAQGMPVIIAGELYSDSLRSEGTGTESYLLTAKANIDAIVLALR